MNHSATVAAFYLPGVAREVLKIGHTAFQETRQVDPIALQLCKPGLLLCRLLIIYSEVPQQKSQSCLVGYSWIPILRLLGRGLTGSLSLLCPQEARLLIETWPYSLSMGI